MKRLFFLAVLMAWIIVGFGAALNAQTKVMYRDKDPAKRPEVNGTIESENPSEIKLKPNIGATKTFQVADILDVQYEVKADLKKDWNRAWTIEWTTAQKHPPDSNERKAALKEALNEYTKLLPKLAGSKEAERHIQYKIGMLTATLAAGDKTQMKLAAELLDKFQKAHPKSWQIVSALNRLSELYLELGDFEKAAGVFDALKGVPGVSPETKADCDLKSADLLIRAKKHSEAATRLAVILKSVPAGPVKEQLEMKLILCKANTPDKFKEAIGELKKKKESTKDPAKLALIHNTLGDCYLMNNQPKDALYEYLYVDMIYNTDKNEQVRAVTQLVQVFKELRQPDRAKEYAMKLEKLKGS